MPRDSATVVNTVSSHFSCTKVFAVPTSEELTDYSGTLAGLSDKHVTTDPCLLFSRVYQMFLW